MFLVENGNGSAYPMGCMLYVHVSVCAHLFHLGQEELLEAKCKAEFDQMLHLK